MRRISLMLILLCSSLCPRRAAARPTLRPFPPEVMTAYASILTRGELAVVETDDKGHARQVSVLGYAAAPPEVVHDVVANPERYPTFVRNLVRADVERKPDGAIVNRWKVSYPIGGFEGVDELRLSPGPSAPIDTIAIGPGKQGVFRWEFLPAPGGGTVVVEYAWDDPLDGDSIVLKLMGKNPAFEAGLELAGGLTVMRGVLAEAGKRAGQKGLTIVSPSLAWVNGVAPAAPGFSPLLDRGTLAVIRSGKDGAPIDVSVVERVRASRQTLLDVVRAPDRFPEYVSIAKRCEVKERSDGGMVYEMSAAAVIIDSVTTFRLTHTPDGADTLGIEGSLKGARYRWDISDGKDGALLIWRGNLRLGDSSALVRSVFRVEPTFEHSANVTVGLMAVRSIAERARALENAANMSKTALKDASKTVEKTTSISVPSAVSNAASQPAGKAVVP